MSWGAALGDIVEMVVSVRAGALTVVLSYCPQTGASFCVQEDVLLLDGDSLLTGLVLDVVARGLRLEPVVARIMQNSAPLGGRTRLGAYKGTSLLGAWSPTARRVLVPGSRRVHFPLDVRGRWSPGPPSSGTGMFTSLLHAHGQRQTADSCAAGEVAFGERVVQLVERHCPVDRAPGAHDGLAVDPHAVDDVHDLVGEPARCRRVRVHLVEVAAVEGGIAFEPGRAARMPSRLLRR